MGNRLCGTTPADKGQHNCSEFENCLDALKLKTVSDMNESENCSRLIRRALGIPEEIHV